MAASPILPHDDAPIQCGVGRHALQVVGYLQGPRPAWLDCKRPLLVVCKHCDYQTRWACSGHRESACRPCAGRYRRRVRSVANSGMHRRDGWLYLLTLTAPGSQRHGRRVRGAWEWCDCTPAGGVHLAQWNAEHSRRWNHFRTNLRRDVSDRVEFFRGVEVQARGALHDHAMVWSPVPLSKERLRDLAVRCGFGHSVDLAPCAVGSRKAAYYVSKYVTKASDSRALVPWLAELVDVTTGELYSAVIAGRYRTWSMSRNWGRTMAQIRAEAADYARDCRDREDRALVDVLVSGLGAVEITEHDETPPSPS